MLLAQALMNPVVRPRACSTRCGQSTGEKASATGLNESLEFSTYLERIN